MIYAYVPQGDVIECNKWLPYAREKLGRLNQGVATTRTPRSVVGVEIILQTKPNRILIKALAGSNIYLAPLAFQIAEGGFNLGQDYSNPVYSSVGKAAWESFVPELDLTGSGAAALRFLPLYSALPGHRDIFFQGIELNEHGNRIFCRSSAEKPLILNEKKITGNKFDAIETKEFGAIGFADGFYNRVWVSQDGKKTANSSIKVIRNFQRYQDLLQDYSPYTLFYALTYQTHNGFSGGIDTVGQDDDRSSSSKSVIGAYVGNRFYAFPYNICCEDPNTNVVENEVHAAGLIVQPDAAGNDTSYVVTAVIFSKTNPPSEMLFNNFSLAEYRYLRLTVNTLIDADLPDNVIMANGEVVEHNLEGRLEQLGANAWEFVIPRRFIPLSLDFSPDMKFLYVLGLTQPTTEFDEFNGYLSVSITLYRYRLIDDENKFIPGARETLFSQLSFSGSIFSPPVSWYISAGCQRIQIDSDGNYVYGFLRNKFTRSASGNATNYLGSNNITQSQLESVTLTTGMDFVAAPLAPDIVVLDVYDKPLSTTTKVKKPLNFQIPAFADYINRAYVFRTPYVVEYDRDDETTIILLETEAVITGNQTALSVNGVVTLIDNCVSAMRYFPGLYRGITNGLSGYCFIGINGPWFGGLSYQKGNKAYIQASDKTNDPNGIASIIVLDVVGGGHQLIESPVPFMSGYILEGKK